jgi:hypothetical protein
MMGNGTHKVRCENVGYAHPGRALERTAATGSNSVTIRPASSGEESELNNILKKEGVHSLACGWADL